MSRVVKFRVWYRYLDHDKWRALAKAVGDDECPEYTDDDTWHNAMEAWETRDKTHRLAASTYRMFYPDKFGCTGHGFGWEVGGGHSDLFHMYPDNVAAEGAALEQFTGIKDSTGRDIYEGDIIIGSEARFEKEQIADDIYVLDVDKPLPAPDVPFFRAVVEWNESFCGFSMRYLWRRPDWGPAASGNLIDKQYVYTVIGNEHENPELLTP